MPTSLYDDGPARRRGPEPPDPSYSDDEARGRGAEGEEYPDKMGYGRRRRDRDLSGIDSMHCLSKGDEARSEYVKLHEPAMQKREEDFTTAQAAYVLARGTVLAGQEAIAAALAELRKRVLCLIEHDEGQQKTLDLAWLRVKDRHERCQRRMREAEQITDCDFPCDFKAPLAELLSRKATFDDRVTRAEDQFAELVKEPAELTTRGTDLQKDVTELQDLVDTAPVDAELAYARLLVAEYHHEYVWGDFDSANEYEDSLRTCLRCSVHGRRALTAIIGEIAVRQCRHDKRKQRCTQLKDNLATEVIAEAKEIEHHHRQREQATGK
jgi:hypothetical protein